MWHLDAVIQFLKDNGPGLKEWDGGDSPFKGRSFPQVSDCFTNAHEATTALAHINHLRPSSLSATISCIARHLYDEDQKELCAHVLRTHISHVGPLSPKANDLLARALLETQQFEEYIERTEDDCADDTVWNRTLASIRTNNVELARQNVEFLKQRCSNVEMALLLFSLSDCAEALTVIGSADTNTSADKQAARTTADVQIYAQMPHRALPYLIKLQLMEQEDNARFMAFIDRCRCLIFMNKCEEALALLQESKLGFEQSHQQKVHILLTTALANLVSHKLQNFYSTIKLVVRQPKQDTSTDLAVDIHLMEMMACYYYNINDLQKSLKTAQTLVKHIQESNDGDHDAQLVTAFVLIGQIFCDCGEFKLSEVALLKAWDIARATDVPSLSTLTLSTLTALYKTSGDKEKRYSYLKKQLSYLAIYDGTWSMGFEWRCRVDYGDYLVGEDQLQEALVEYERALVIVQELGLVVEEADICSKLSMVASKSGDEEFAQVMSHQALVIWTQLPYGARTDEAKEQLARTSLVMGQHTQVIALCSVLATNAERARTRVRASCLLAQALLQDKQLVRVVEVVERAKKEAKERGYVRELGLIYGLLGEYYTVMGNSDMASKSFYRQIGYLNYMNSPADQCDALKCLINHRVMQKDLSVLTNLVKLRIKASARCSPRLHLNVLNQSVEKMISLGHKKVASILLDDMSSLLLDADFPDCSSVILDVFNHYISLNQEYKAETAIGAYLNQYQGQAQHYMALGQVLTSFDKELAVELLESGVECGDGDADLVCMLIRLLLECGHSEKAEHLAEQWAENDLLMDFHTDLMVQTSRGRWSKEEAVRLSLKLNEQDQTSFLGLFDLYSYVDLSTEGGLHLTPRIHYLIANKDFAEARAHLQTTGIKETVVIEARLSPQTFPNFTEKCQSSDDIQFLTVVEAVLFRQTPLKSILSLERNRRRLIAREYEKAGHVVEVTEPGVDGIQENFVYTFTHSNVGLAWVSDIGQVKLVYKLDQGPTSFWERVIIEFLNDNFVERISNTDFEEHITSASVIYGDICFASKRVQRYLCVESPLRLDEREVQFESGVVMVGQAFSGLSSIDGFVWLKTQSDQFQGIEQLAPLTHAAIVFVDPSEFNPLLWLQLRIKPQVLFMVGKPWNQSPVWTAVLASAKWALVCDSVTDLNTQLVSLMQECITGSTITTAQLRSAITAGQLICNSHSDLFVKCAAIELRTKLQKAVQHDSIDSWLEQHSQFSGTSIQDLRAVVDLPRPHMPEIVRCLEEPEKTLATILYKDYCVTSSDLNRLPTRRRSRMRRRRSMSQRSKTNSRCSSRNSFSGSLFNLDECDLADTETETGARILCIGLQ